MSIFNQIEEYLQCPSQWRFTGSSGLSASLVLGVGFENLFLEKHGQSLHLRYTSLSGGFGVQTPASGSFSTSDMDSGDILNRIYLGPLQREELTASDFEGFARCVSVGAGLQGLGRSFGMYVFGTAALIASGALTIAPPASIASALGLANAVGFVNTTSLSSPQAGITFAIGGVEIARHTLLPTLPKR